MKVGRVTAQGTVSGATFTAITVHIVLSEVAGAVTAKTSDTFTVTRRDGTPIRLHVSGTTTYTVRGSDAATLSDIAVGDRVSAEGLLPYRRLA